MSSDFVADGQGDIRSDFYQSNDLLSLVEPWSYLRNQGDADANFYTAQAYTECFQFLHSPDPQQYIADAKAILALTLQSGPALDRGISHWERLSQRCGSFTAHDQVSTEQIESWLRVAASQGRSAAKIDLLLRNKDSLENSTVEEIHSLLINAIAERDYEALIRLSELMNLEGEIAYQYLGKYSGTQNDSAAWAFVACDLGVDCGPEHPALKTGCMLAGRWCAYSSLTDLYVNEGLTPMALNRVNAKRLEILNLIQRNELDRLFSD